MSGNSSCNSFLNLIVYLKKSYQGHCYPPIIFIFLLLLPTSSLRADPINILTYEEPPYALMVENHQSGILVDILSELFSRTNLEYKLSFIPLKRAILTVENRPGYCVLPIARNQDREVNFQWISPMLISRYGLYSQENASIPLATLSDAQPHIIGSFLGSGIGQYLAGLDFNVELSPASTLNLQKLIRGRFDLWAEDLLSAQYMMRQQNIELGPPELVFYTSIRAMACHRTMPLVQLEMLQTALLSMYKDGFMKRLYHQYGVEI